MLNTLSQLSLSARGDAELGADTPAGQAIPPAAQNEAQAASSTLPTERAQPTLRSENGTADTNTASADMHGAGAASVQSTVSYPADKAEYQRLVSAGVRNLPNTAAEYARFKHTNPEGWYELIRRESRRNPAITSLLDNGAASVAGYTEDAGEDGPRTMAEGETNKTSEMGEPDNTGQTDRLLKYEPRNVNILQGKGFSNQELSAWSQIKVGKYSSSMELVIHLLTDVTKSVKNGITGAHASNSFPFEVVNVLSRRGHSVLNGVEWIEYQLPVFNNRLEYSPGQYRPECFQKTVFDPTVLSPAEYITRGLEAANNAANQTGGILSIKWNGYDKSGVLWEGYFRDGQFGTFYPVV